MSYCNITTITAIELPIPEIDVACFENVMIQSQLKVIPDPSFCHHVVLATIDISANIFKKLFYDTAITSQSFNTLTNGYTDYVFGLIPPPPTATATCAEAEVATIMLSTNALTGFIMEFLGHLLQ